MNRLAPIALFVYNRPVHTRRTLEALEANEFAGESTLFIFSDGPRGDATALERENISEVRKIIREKKWCGEVRILESPENKGLADSIVSGVREILGHSERVIVLEDDIVTGKYFLRYMNEALELYAEDQQVMQVCGFHPSLKVDFPETYFLGVTSCWGWGTWRRAFEHYSSDAAALLAKIQESGRLSEFDLGGRCDYLRQLQANAEGRLKTWAIQWYATVFLNDGLCLYPRQPVVANIGFDGSGSHCKVLPEEELSGIQKPVQVSRIPLEENREVKEALRVHFNPKIPEKSIFKRWFSR